MKAYACQKCADNQRKAGDALGLFNEALGELVDVVEVLNAVEAGLRAQPFAVQAACGIDKVRAAIAQAGERKRVENGIREIIAAT